MTDKTGLSKAIFARSIAEPSNTLETAPSPRNKTTVLSTNTSKATKLRLDSFIAHC